MKAQNVANRSGFKLQAPIGSLEDHFIFQHQSSEEKRLKRSIGEKRKERKLRKDPRVKWMRKQIPLRRVKRSIIASPPTDPLFNDQWYLNQGAADGSDMNVEAAWNLGYTGKGVVVTILDDGIQYNHPDLILNYDAKASTDINGGDDDPSPRDNGENKHGTRCAGEVAAEAFNDICGVGIAYNSSIGGVRMLDGMVNDAVEATALSLNRHHIDIYSASWGPEDDGMTVDGPGTLAKKAFAQGVKKGRRGKGSIFVWASGNGGRKTDNCNCDGYTNSIFTLSISSATQGGRKPWYLEECSSTHAATYSSGTPGHDASIATTDQNFELKRDKICTTSHTGTSASAPIAAAIVALALEANGNLTWRDVQHIVVRTSNYRPLSEESGWQMNGMRRYYSHKFGYGLMDAGKMVSLALKWPSSVEEQKRCETPVIVMDDTDIPIDSNFVTRTKIFVDGCDQVKFLEHVQCVISLKFSPRGALHIVLVSPSGTRSSLLMPRPRDLSDSGFDKWPFLSVHFWGENPFGMWILEINRHPDILREDQVEGGFLRSWKLAFYGTKENPFPEAEEENGVAISLFEDHKLDSSEGERVDEECRESLFSLNEKCVGSCPPETFGSAESRRCEKCHDSCRECRGPGENDCLSCFPERFYTEDKNMCTEKCKFGYYEKGTYCAKVGHEEEKEDKGTVPEGNKLDLAAGESPAERCEESQFERNGKCVGKCPEKTFPSSEGGNCEECHNSCRECRGSGERDCLSCSKGRYFTQSENMCTEKCPPGFYESTAGKNCRKCRFENCEKCSGENRCLKCKGNFALSGGRCVSRCPETHYRENKIKDGSKCIRCHAKCASCFGPRATQCARCKEGLFYYQRKCVDSCPGNFRPIDGECSHCPEGCDSCTRERKCLHCYPGFVMETSSRRCFPLANKFCRSQGQYADNLGKCRNCSQKCLQCSDQNNCLLCKGGYLLHIGSCVQECPKATFGENGECVHCPHTCQECSDFSTCSLCHSGLKLHKDRKCLTECPEGFFDDQRGKCQKCHESCQGCSDSESCQNCKKPYFLSSHQNGNGKCVKKCPDGSFEDEEDSKCKECKLEGVECRSENSLNHCKKCQEQQQNRKWSRSPFQSIDDFSSANLWLKLKIFSFPLSLITVVLCILLRRKRRKGFRRRRQEKSDKSDCDHLKLLS